LGAVTSALVSLAMTALPSRQATDEGIPKRLASLFADRIPNDAPGLAVLVKREGRVLIEAGYGVRSLAGQEKIDAHTNFRLASLSKQFTAMAVMLLVHDGRLRYEEKLTEIFPEFPAYGKTISVRNLLDHTSGLPDYEELMERAEKERGTRWTAARQIRDDEVLTLLEQTDHGKFPPGTNWEYSNSGYVVLGLIVAKRAGESFGEFLHQRVFAPLKMSSTLLFENGKNEVPDRAYGHSLKNGALKETDQSPTSATQGDGGVYSNLADLSRWDDALRNHTLLGEADFAPAVTPRALPAGAERKLAEDVPAALRGQARGYGFGWFLDLEDAHPLMWHYGDTVGFKSVILRYTRDQITVIVLSNRSDLDPAALALESAVVLGLTGTR
jgi:CubicO group peptidase (beta-lactamase class C family)